MRGTYRVLAYLIAVLVAVQAAMIAFAVSGLGKWVDEGGVLDRAAMEQQEESLFAEEIGFAIHGFFNGLVLIPLVALILLIVSFFAKVPRGIALAATVLGLVVLQVLLGMFSRGAGLPVLGLLHGLNALVLFTVAVVAARSARSPAPTQAPAEPAGV